VARNQNELCVDRQSASSSPVLRRKVGTSARQARDNREGCLRDLVVGRTMAPWGASHMGAVWEVDKRTADGEGAVRSGDSAFWFASFLNPSMNEAETLATDEGWLVSQSAERIVWTIALTGGRRRGIDAFTAAWLIESRDRTRNGRGRGALEHKQP